MFEKTKRLKVEDLQNMATSCKHEFNVTDVERVIKEEKEEEEEEGGGERGKGRGSGG